MDRIKFSKNLTLNLNINNMTNIFPVKFNLENGTHVVVNSISNHTYEFTLNPEEGPSHQFTYVHDRRSKTEIEENLSFEEINALRQFWLETENII